MQIMYDNKIISADISCATEDEDYPLENLFESRISRKFRTTDDADQSIVFDFGEEISINRLAIVGHNFREDVEIILSSTELWTQRTSSFGTDYINGITYGNGIFVAVGLSGKLATSPDGITWTQRTSSFGTDHIITITHGDGLFVAGGTNGKLATSFREIIDYDENIILHQFDDISVSSITLLIDDANSNSDGYLEIGYLYLGEYLQLPNMKIDQDLNAETTSTVAYSESGQAYGKEGYIFRQPKINFPAMTNAQKEGLQELFSTVKNITPFICAIWANRLDIEPALYCVLNQKNIAFKRSDNYNAPWATTIELREVF